MQSRCFVHKALVNLELTLQGTKDDLVRMLCAPDETHDRRLIRTLLRMDTSRIFPPHSIAGMSESPSPSTIGNVATTVRERLIPLRPSPNVRQDHAGHISNSNLVVTSQLNLVEICASRRRRLGPLSRLASRPQFGRTGKILTQFVLGRFGLVHVWFNHRTLLG